MEKAAQAAHIAEVDMPAIWCFEEKSSSIDVGISTRGHATALRTGEKGIEEIRMDGWVPGCKTQELRVQYVPQ